MEPKQEMGKTTEDPTSRDQNQGQNLPTGLKANFDAKYGIVDILTPRNAYMSGKYKRSHAYDILRNHLPVVLTKIIDSITKDKNELIAQFGEGSREELKMLIGNISRMKYELQTDKPFNSFEGEESDCQLWNTFISELPKDECSYYKACLMHTECFTYRKLYSFVENSIFLKDFDFFRKTKEHFLTRSQDEILSLSKYTRRLENNMETFGELLKFSLWSNKNDIIEDDCDVRSFNMKVLENLSNIDQYMLVNHIEDIWNSLSDEKTDNKYVDIVLDNCGYELFADLILAEYIIDMKLATKVRFHVKAYPSFVSGVTSCDLQFTINYLVKSTEYIISLIGQKFVQYLEEGRFEVAPTSYFWTSPHPFSSMSNMERDLYCKLQESKLIIFKGDFNYRKLLSDVCRDSSQDMHICLGGFRPTNLCAIRIVKSEVICGLTENVYNELLKKDVKWMSNGNYGVIQFVDGRRDYA